MSIIQIGMDTDKVEKDIARFYIDRLLVRISELEKELEEAMTFNVDVVRCLSRIASVENHNEVPAYIDMSRRCIKTIKAKQAKALKVEPKTSSEGAFWVDLEETLNQEEALKEQE
jgi:hypothetical protein